MRVKRTTALLLLLALLLAIPVVAYADNRGLIVYIASGSSSAYRYHARSDCSSLSRSVVASVTLEEAASRGFSPCSRCNPPAPDFEVTVPTKSPTASSGFNETRASTSSRTPTINSRNSIPIVVAKIIVAAAMILGWLFMLCLILHGAFHRNEKISDFFLGIADFCRIVLLIGIPIWFPALLLAIGK